jgi:uncharacterized protein with HEPN domain
LRRDPKSVLWDARDAATAIADMTAGKSFADFDSDLLRSAVERQLEILGEALGQLARIDPMLAAKIPDLRQVVAFRNVLIHGYALIDRARVWRAVQDDLPTLRATVATSSPDDSGVSAWPPNTRVDESGRSSSTDDL